MNIGLFFGSFNPIHIGHLIVANHIATLGIIDQVWLVLSPQNPFKKQTDLLNEYHRKYLVEIAIDGERKIKCSSIEFGLPKPSYTIDTLTYLKEKHPENVFSLILGSDSLTNITKWKSGDKILKTYSLIVYQRFGLEVENKNLPKNISVIDCPRIEISSSYIRQRIKQGKSIRFFVPDSVYEEILRNHYYKPPA